MPNFFPDVLDSIHHNSIVKLDITHVLPDSSGLALKLYHRALILMSALRKKMRDTKLIEKYTVRELLLEMETLTQVRYSGKYGHILTEITKPQREILQSLEIQPET